MSGLKRPEKYVEFESIKPKLKDLVEFYTKKSQEHRQRILEFSEYADGLEKEISILKENSKVEVLLDSTDKQLVVVPQIVADWFEKNKHDLEFMVWQYINHWDNQEENEFKTFMDFNSNKPIQTIFKMLDGYTVEKEKKYILKHIDLSEQCNYNFLYLSHVSNIELGHERIAKGIDMSKIKQCHFTQTEIDKLNIGSYVKIRVEP